MEAQDGGQTFVDPPHLLGGDMSGRIAQPVDVDGTDLFNQHPGQLSVHDHLGPEGRRPGAS